MKALALITGATSGIGEELARLLARLGHPLILTGRREEKLLALKQELPGSIEILAADLASPRERERLAALIREKKPIWVFNNAGFGAYGKTDETALKTLEDMVEVNVDAVVEISWAAARALKEGKLKGTILNVSSMVGFSPYPGMATYAATKAFVNSFSQSLDIELDGTGIRVLAACPGQTATSFGDRASGKVRERKPSKWMMDPMAVAKEIVEQVEKGERIRIIDYRYRFLNRLRHLIPSTFLMRKTLKSLLKRAA